MENEFYDFFFWIDICYLFPQNILKYTLKNRGTLAKSSHHGPSVSTECSFMNFVIMYQSI